MHPSSRRFAGTSRVRSASTTFAGSEAMWWNVLNVDCTVMSTMDQTIVVGTRFQSARVAGGGGNVWPEGDAGDRLLLILVEISDRGVGVDRWGVLDDSNLAAWRERGVATSSAGPRPLRRIPGRRGCGPSGSQELESGHSASDPATCGERVIRVIIVIDHRVLPARGAFHRRPIHSWVPESCDQLLSSEEGQARREHEGRGPVLTDLLAALRLGHSKCKIPTRPINC